VLTVGKDARGVERMLKEGSLACPGCEGRLAPWGHARRRVVFGAGRRGRVVRPRRSRCRGCGVTHVLLPAGVLARRPDEAGVIGAALAAAARGAGHRRIARLLGVPADTVRGWLRRFAGRAGQVRDAFARVAVAVSADPVPLAPAGSAVADAVVAVAAAAEAVGRRWPRLLTVSPWEVACAVTNASLMAPVIMVRAVNTSSPLPAGGR
jgi:transposase-like protein